MTVEIDGASNPSQITSEIFLKRTSEVKQTLLVKGRRRRQGKVPQVTVFEYSQNRGDICLLKIRLLFFLDLLQEFQQWLFFRQQVFHARRRKDKPEFKAVDIVGSAEIIYDGRLLNILRRQHKNDSDLLFFYDGPETQ